MWQHSASSAGIRPPRLPDPSGRCAMGNRNVKTSACRRIAGLPRPETLNNSPIVGNPRRWNFNISDPAPLAQTAHRRLQNRKSQEPGGIRSPWGEPYTLPHTRAHPQCPPRVISRPPEGSPTILTYAGAHVRLPKGRRRATKNGKLVTVEIG